MLQRIIVVSPRGFCAGVARAIATVERALATYPPRVYVRRAIVHNADVVGGLAAAGAIFVDELSEVPRGSVVVLSAHGVSAAVREEALARDLRIVDATCPLVAKVHREVRRFSQLGYELLLIGHAGHDEVVGTLGQAPNVRLVEPGSPVEDIQVASADRVACVTQTTLSAGELDPMLDRLRQRFPALAEPRAADVCYATRNRQAAIAWLARKVDVVLVVGDQSSSNSQRLCEVASRSGAPAYLIASVAELQGAWLTDAKVVGLSAGASTPEHLVIEVLDHLSRDGAVVERQAFLDERVSFAVAS